MGFKMTKCKTFLGIVTAVLMFCIASVLSIQSEESVDKITSVIETCDSVFAGHSMEKALELDSGWNVTLQRLPVTPLPFIGAMFEDRIAWLCEHKAVKLDMSQWKLTDSIAIIGVRLWLDTSSGLVLYGRLSFAAGKPNAKYPFTTSELETALSASFERYTGLPNRKANISILQAMQHISWVGLAENIDIRYVMFEDKSPSRAAPPVEAWVFDFYGAKSPFSKESDAKLSTHHIVVDGNTGKKLREVIVTYQPEN
jgi:hypothetical protein